MSRRLWLGGATVLGAVAVVALALALGSASGGSARPALYRVHPRDFVRQVEARGTLEAVRSTPISVPLTLTQPTKIAWLARDGKRVKKGELIARLDPTDFESELRDGEGSLESVKEKIAKAEAARRASILGLDLDAAMASDEEKLARTFQRRDTEIFSRYERIESQIDASLARAKMEHAEGVKKSRQALDASNLELLGIDRSKARRKVALAKQGLASIEVRAPHDGILLLAKNWRGEPNRVGDIVWGGRKLAEIPDLAQMKVKAFVLEADAGGLAPGQKARVTIEADPATTWKATVSQLEAIAKPRVRGVPVQYFGLTLALEKTDPATMKPGQTITAEIEVANKREVLAIPREAVFQRDGGNVVFRWNGHGFERTKVELSDASLGWAVVTAGLQDGAEVALADPSREPASAEDDASGASSPDPVAGASE